MNHSEAVQSNACEKYLLGELSPDLRDAYEEHYFACSECSAQLSSAAQFLGIGRQVLAEPGVAAVGAEPDYVRPPRGWFPWLSPWVAGPAFAALLLVVGYQNLVTIPRFRQAAAPRVLPMFSLINSNTRGAEGLSFSVAPNQSFGLFVDLPVQPEFTTYLVRLEDPSGSSTLLRSLSSSEAQDRQVITVNPGTRAGNYALVISGLATSSADISSAKALARLQFAVELKN